MTRTTLLLVTNTYPYGFGETFLETEIDFLAKNFDKVIVLPFRKSNQLRKTPENVITQHFFTENSRWYILFHYLIGTVRSKEFRDELRSLDSSVKILSFVRLLLFNCKSFYIKDQLEKYIVDGKIESNHCLVYTYWLTSAAYGLGLLKEKFPGIKLVSRAHGYDLYAERYLAGYVPMQYQSLLKLDRLFLISEHGYHYISRKYNCQKQGILHKLAVARLGVKKTNRGTQFSYKGSEDNQIFRIVSCSAMIKIKRLDLLIDALSILDKQDKGIKIEWHHVGGGKARKSIERSARKKLSCKVSYFFHGVLTNEQVLDLYHQSGFDLFINVSDSEGIPVSIMEALSYGIPVLARNVGGIAEIINNDNGLLLKKALSPEALSEALETLMNKLEQWPAKRQAAIETWANDFNADENYEQFSSALIAL